MTKRMRKFTCDALIQRPPESKPTSSKRAKTKDKNPDRFDWNSINEVHRRFWGKTTG